MTATAIDALKTRWERAVVRDRGLVREVAAEGEKRSPPY